MESYKSLLLANKAWVKERLNIDEHYFSTLSKDQQPEFLWIGCSDSRVPAEEITGTQPGDIFVHRNVANLVLHTDINLQSVLHYAVEVLRVKHIIVCGHYGCGGVRAAMTKQRFGIMDEWLRNIKDTYFTHRETLEGISDDGLRTDKLVELNVYEQLQNITKTRAIQRAWKHHQRPTLHGWIFSMTDGSLKSLYKIEPGSAIESIYTYDDTYL